MKRLQPICIFAGTCIAGIITPFILPGNWLHNLMHAGPIGLLIFGALSAKREKPKAPTKSGLLFWLLIGMERPMAKLVDPEALLVFFLIATYFAGFTAGMFLAAPV